MIPASIPNALRIAIVGNSSTGKSTLAAQLGELLGLPTIELDALQWGPNWQKRADFIQAVDAATRNPAWISAGNYREIRDVLWPRATLIVWLDYGLPLTLWRGIRRALRRSVTREVLWGGNRESLARTFLSRDSILVWILKTHYRRRREFAALQSSEKYAHAQWLHFRTPAQTAAWLQEIEKQTLSVKMEACV